MEKKQDLDRRVADFEAHYEAQRDTWARMVEHINNNPERIARIANENSKPSSFPLHQPAAIHGGARGATMLSSPPRSTASGTTDNEATPKQPGNANSGHQPKGLLSPIQLPSPGNGSRGDPIVIDRKMNCAVERMMAKHKRGEALDGLLKLMETSTEYDALDEWTG